MCSGAERVSRREGTKMRKACAASVLVVCTLFFLQAGAQGDKKFSAKAQERITKEVRHRILMLSDFGTFDNIEFKLNGYDVVLAGQVTRPSLKSDAERVVKKIEGVEHVDNQIEVLPTSPNDDRLRRDVFNAIYRYAPLQHYGVGSNRPIHIIVNHGNVTLEGVVDRESDKNMAGLQANEVPGVFSLRNNLFVPGKESRR
jgi:hyperosmotically inducible protein